MTSFEMTRADVVGVRKELCWLKVRIARAGPAQNFNIFRWREVPARPLPTAVLFTVNNKIFFYELFFNPNYCMSI
jgi:hypothetical protein